MYEKPQQVKGMVLLECSVAWLPGSATWLAWRRLWVCRFKSIINTAYRPATHSNSYCQLMYFVCHCHPWSRSHALPPTSSIRLLLLIITRYSKCVTSKPRHVPNIHVSKRSRDAFCCDWGGEGSDRSELDWVRLMTGHDPAYYQHFFMATKEMHINHPERFFSTWNAISLVPQTSTSDKFCWYISIYKYACTPCKLPDQIDHWFQ